MKKVKIGYIFSSPNLTHEEKVFLKVARKKNIQIIMFNLAEELSEEEIERKAKDCDLIFNNTAGYMAIELSKTLEELGKKVIESSKVFYYTEDKWMFFLKCKEHKIPSPETILLSTNLDSAKKELEKFNQWPVILKRVNGEQGEFVEKADNLKEAEKLIKIFWNKGKERLPVIAQEFVRSKSYRVTVIDDKIIQTAIKDGHGWKSTGHYAEKIDSFKIDEPLKKLVKRLSKIIDINICGMDFLKDKNKWVVIEVNAEPSFEFFENDMERVIGKVLDFLKKKAGKKR